MMYSQRLEQEKYCFLKNSFWGKITFNLSIHSSSNCSFHNNLLLNVHQIYCYLIKKKLKIEKNKRWRMQHVSLKIFLSTNLSLLYSIHIFSIYLSTHLFIHLSIYFSTNLSLLLSIHIFFHLSIYPSIYLSVYTYVYIYLSIYLTSYICLYLSIHLFNFSSIYITIYLSIHPSIYF